MLKWATLIWVAAGIIIAWTIPPALNLRATPAAFFHVPTALAMEIAFVVSAINGAGWLWKRDVAWDARSVAFAETGFALGLTALVSGAVWAKINWNAYWSWDPQQIGIVATLLTYAALFSLRGATEDEARKRNAWAVFAILGLIAAIFWTFVFRHLMPSLHPNQTLTGSDPLFKWTLRFNIIGFTLLTVWVSLLRARLMRLESVAQDKKQLQWTQ